MDRLIQTGVGRIRLLFVDDESSIRMTLPAILRQEGFEVAVAANVQEGLGLIQRERFDVLLTDLNIQGPGDGFVLVSAMRRLQPEATTFIITGYPDFETALEAIRKLVDDYFTKPADVHTLVESIKERLRSPRHLRNERPKRVATVLRENSGRIVELWLAEVLSDDKLRSVEMSDDERIDDLPAIIQRLARDLESGRESVEAEVRKAAIRHGELRARAGYAAPQLVSEARILNKVIAEVIQEHLLEVDLSALVGEVLKIGEHLNASIEDSLDAFERVRKAQVA